MNVWLNRFRTFDWRNTWPKVVAAVPVIIFILIPVFTSGEVILNMLVLSGIWAVAAMGFTLILRTGQFSLGQAAFMAIGGYTSAILTVVLGWPWIGKRAGMRRRGTWQATAAVGARPTMRMRMRPLNGAAIQFPIFRRLGG